MGKVVSDLRKPALAQTRLVSALWLRKIGQMYFQHMIAIVRKKLCGVRLRERNLCSTSRQQEFPQREFVASANFNAVNAEFSLRTA